MHWSKKYSICLKGVKVEHSRKEVVLCGVMRALVELYWNQIGTDNSGLGHLSLLCGHLLHCCVSVRLSCV